RKDGYQQPMLVDIVQSVQCPQGVIPSVVRFYRVADKRDEFVPNSLYFPITKGVYKFLPRLFDRKIKEFVRTASAQRDQFPHHEVESGAHSVNSLAHDQPSIFGSGGNEFQGQNILSGIRIFLRDHTVKVSLDEGIEQVIKITDFLIGAFDL